MSSEGESTIPESEIEARRLVAHEYHLRMVEALAAERNEARAEVERLTIALENALAADTESETRDIIYKALTPPTIPATSG